MCVSRNSAKYGELQQTRKVTQFFRYIPCVFFSKNIFVLKRKKLQLCLPSFEDDVEMEQFSFENKTAQMSADIHVRLLSCVISLIHVRFLSCVISLIHVRFLSCVISLIHVRFLSCAISLLIRFPTLPSPSSPAVLFKLLINDDADDPHQ